MCNVIEPIALRIETMAMSQAADMYCDVSSRVAYQVAVDPVQSDQGENIRRVIESVVHEERIRSIEEDGADPPTPPLSTAPAADPDEDVNLANVNLTDVLASTLTE